MEENYVIIADNMTYPEFLAEQETRHDRFCVESRITFHKMVEEYFRSDHHLSEEIMADRRIEVIF